MYLMKCIFCRLSLRIRQKISSRQLKGDHVQTRDHGIVCINSVRCEHVLSLGCQRVTRGYVFVRFNTFNFIQSEVQTLVLWKLN